MVPSVVDLMLLNPAETAELKLLNNEFAFADTVALLDTVEKSEEPLEELEALNEPEELEYDPEERLVGLLELPKSKA